MKRDFDNFHATFKPIYVCQFYNLPNLPLLMAMYMLATDDFCRQGN